MSGAGGVVGPPAQTRPPPQPPQLPPEQAERERNDGRVSPIPTMQPVNDFLESLKEAGAHAKPYQILGPLGKGKFAMVYKASLHVDGEDRLFALKKVAIFEMMNEASRNKCLKEIQLLQGLNHQNIIRYEDSYIDLQTNELVIVLQWARGGDLKKLIRKVKSGQAKISEFSESMIWKYCTELSNGLEYMHEKRVMHRDLKPANIMLTHDNHVLIGDLGLSRYFNPATLEAFSKVGTPLYLSPEVLMGTGYGFGADTWSLGCILYELCTLSSPFKPTTEGVNLYALFANIRAGKYEPIPPLTPSGASYSDNLRSLITAMIRIDPQARPTMQQVASVARKMVEQRLGKQLQAKENQAQAMQLYEEEKRKAAAAAAAAASASPPAASASPVLASPSPSPSSASTAAPSSSPAPPSSHLAVQFPDESPIALTPVVSSLPISRPLNASPLPSAAAVQAVAAELAELKNNPRAMSPISPILQRPETLEQRNGSATAVTVAPSVSPVASSVSPPVIVNRPPSATRPASASRPISASHRPSSGTQRPVAAVASAVGPSANATAAPAPKIMSPPLERPSSKESVRPSSREQAERRPISQSGSHRPTSSSSNASAARPASGSQQRPASRSLLDASGRVDHFPADSSKRPPPLHSPARMASPSILGSLSDSREEQDESSMDSGGAHSPARIGRGGGGGINHGGQSFLYDRASPSPSPSPSPHSGPPSGESGKSSFHLADPANAQPLAAVPEQNDRYHAAAHTSFADLAPPASEVPPPLVAIEHFRPPSATTNGAASAAAVRPLSRGAVNSASGARQQPVLARPLSGTVISPPASTSTISASAAASNATAFNAKSPPSAAAFLEEELSPMSPPPPVQRSRSINRDSTGLRSPPAANGSAVVTSPNSRSGGESSRINMQRVKSASNDRSTSSFKSPSRRLPLSHFTDSNQPEQDDDEDDLLSRPHANAAASAASPALPPRPVSVDAPQRPAPTPSALLVASAALPFPSVEGMMEDVLEALKMLHYESRFCARWKLPWLSREFFVQDFATLWSKQNSKASKKNDARGAAATANSVSTFAVSLSAAPPNPPPTQSQQLLYFGYLSLWLLSFLLRPSGGGKDAVDNEQLSSLLGELSSWREYADYRDADEGEPDDRRASLAATILSHLALLKLPLPSPGLTVDSLAQSASGERLLQLLFRLTQAVYYKKLHGSVVLSPLALRHYPVFEPNPELAAAEAEVEEEEEAAVEEEDMEEAALDDDADPAYAAAGGGTNAAEESSAPQSEVERARAAEAWNEEFKRVSESSALALNLNKIPPSGRREWHGRREAVVKHSATLFTSPLVAVKPTAPTITSPSAAAASSPAAAFLTPALLPNRAAELRRTLDRIFGFESRLAKDPSYKSLADEYATVRTRLEEVQAQYSALSGSNATDATHLQSLDESLSSTLAAVKSLRDGEGGGVIAGGAGSIRQISQAVARLRAEIAAMNVAIGIKSNSIRSFKVAEQKQRMVAKHSRH